MKKTLSVILALFLCISLFPFAALAAEDEIPKTQEAVGTEITEENKPAPENAEKNEESLSEGAAEPMLLSENEESEEAPIVSVTPELDILTAKNFPDATFLQSLKDTFPSGLSVKEALEVENLSVSMSSDITGLAFFPNLVRLEFSIGNAPNPLDLSGFAKLEDIFIWENNTMRSLILRDCVSLKNFSIPAGQLESLDLSGCTSLQDIYIYYSNLSELKLTGCTNLKSLYLSNGMAYRPYRELAVLDVSETTALESLTAYGNIRSVNFGTNENLKTIELRSNIPMHTLDLSGLTNLENMYIEECGLTWLDLRNNSKIVNGRTTQTNSVVYGTPVGNDIVIDLGEVMPDYCFSRVKFADGVNYDAAAGIVTVPSGTEQIAYTFSVYGGEDMSVTAAIVYRGNILTKDYFPDPSFIEEIKREVKTDYLTAEQAAEVRNLYLVLDLYTENLTGLEYFTGLETLNISMARDDDHMPKIDVVDFSAQTKLKELTLFAVNFGNLILNGNNELEYFTIFPVSYIDNISISNCGKLRSVVLFENEVESLSFTNCGALVSFAFADGKCKSLRVASCPNLETIVFEKCQLEEFSAKDCYMVKDLSFNSNPLKTLDLSFCENLDNLSVYDTELTELDLHSNLKLTSLICRGAKLHELNLFSNTELEYLDCGDNELTSLDLSNNRKLTDIICENNHLAYLDLSANTALKNATLSPQRFSVNAVGAYGLQKKCIYMDMFLPYEQHAMVKSVENGEFELEHDTMTTSLTNETVEYIIGTGNEAFPEMNVSAAAPAALVITYRDSESTLPPFPLYYKNTDKLYLHSPTTEKVGAEFSGWFFDTEYTESADVLPASMTGNIIVYPYYVMRTYSVEFDANGGSGEMEELWDVECGTAFRLPKNEFTRVGYTFDSWNTAPNGTGYKYIDNETVSNLSLEDGDIVTLYAQWKRARYTIRFNGNGSTSGTMTGNTMFCDPDTTYTLPANAFKKTGYLFVGWNTSPDGTGVSFPDRAAVENLYNADGSDTILYAIWTNRYPVFFDKNGGYGHMSSQTLTINERQALTKNAFTREGYIFLGWGLSPNDTTPSYSDGQQVRNLSKSLTGVTLYALWQKSAQNPVKPTEPEKTSEEITPAEDPEPTEETNPPAETTDPAEETPTDKDDKSDEPLPASIFGTGSMGLIAAGAAIVLGAVIAAIAVGNKKKR